MMVNKEEYILRISKANPAQLVVINFELTIAALDDALARNDFTLPVEKAKNGLEQLIRSLNFEVPLAHDFYEIYKYVNQLLITAQFSRDAENVKQAVTEARELLDTLLTGWRDVEQQVADLPPVAGKTPIVYSGLTYSKDGTADEYIDDGDKKGFMA